jgi:uncharacterized SAM-binding protein YcdF (DUF218 family)
MSESARVSSFVTSSLAERMEIASATDRLRRGGQLVRLTIVLGILCAVLLFIGFLFFVYSLDPSENEPHQRADAIVVLTGGADRIADAVQLLAEGHGARLLISGVNKGISPESIAKLMPQHADLFACCIDLDYGARNTVGNATETRRWARDHKIKSILLVTSNYHMPRALLEFRRAMPRAQVSARAVVPYGFDASRWWSDLGTARVLTSEYAKLLAAWSRSIAAPTISDSLDATSSVKRLSVIQ